MSMTGDVFGTGMTFASFHCIGTCASLIEVLKIIVTGSEISIEKLLRIQFGRRSGPGALFDFTAFKRNSTSTMDIGCATVDPFTGSLSALESGGNDSVAAKKPLLIAVAKSRPCKIDPFTSAV